MSAVRSRKVAHELILGVQERRPRVIEDSAHRRIGISETGNLHVEIAISDLSKESEFGISGFLRTEEPSPHESRYRKT
jgi:hypothetical protein